VPRLVAVVVALSVGLFAGFDREAFAQGPEPAPGSRPLSLRPDPAPSAHPARTVSSGSASARHRSISPAATLSTHATVSSSPRVSPATENARTSAEKQRPRTIRKTTRKRSHSLSQSALRRFGALPAFLLRRPSIGPIPGPVTESARPESTFLLAGGLALVVLVLGETTFLTLMRIRIGVRPSRRRKQVYRDAEGPIRRIPVGP
jgi:hypothetical protein